ncbi:hypothetical protein BAVI_23548 [Neobacillus vireti LMG 21834]|uniref:Uncharacterized protein n=1 Tax=Neobacillus vireti LMG 21834 TaxID=1131730 RepID=A0AB94IGM1_9BACI|nr:hypothetical protein BAVI_23548 [Neobacillus vireti LMG 21834]
MFSLFENKCNMCKRKIKPLRKYKNDKGKTIKICLDCSVYAERRAFKKVN